MKKALIKAFSALLIFGTLPSAIRQVSANTLTLGTIRLAFGALIIGLIIQRKEKLIPLVRKNWKRLLPIGLCFGVHWFAFFESIKIASASIGAIGISSFGVFLIILGYFFDDRKISLVDVLAVLISVIGTLLVVPEFTLDNSITLGLCYSVFSGFAYSLLPLLHKRQSDLSDNLRIFGQFFFGVFVFLPFFSGTSWQFSQFDYLILFYLVAVCTVLSHGLWVSATTVLPVSTSALLYYLSLPLALLFSYVLLGEQLETRAVVGVVFIFSANICGVVFSNALKEG